MRIISWLASCFSKIKKLDLCSTRERYNFRYLSLSNILTWTSTLSLRKSLIWISTMISTQFFTHSSWVWFHHLIRRCQLVTVENTHWVSTWKKNHCISLLLKLNDNAIPTCRWLPVDVMKNQFDLSDWSYNDDSDLYESIDLIKDYYNLMTDRLRYRILDASPHARIWRQVGIIEKVQRNQCMHCYIIIFNYQTHLAM